MRAGSPLDLRGSGIAGLAVTALAAFVTVGATGCAASTAYRVDPQNAAPAPVSHPISAAATPGPRGESSDSGDPASNRERATRQTNRALGWIAFSLGADSAVVAIVTSFMMLHQNSVRSDDCADKVCSSAGLAANGTLGELAGWNAGAWVVAAVGMGAGAVLLLTNPSDKAVRAEVGVVPTPSGSAFLLRGAF